ncbi:MAG: thiolase [Deltaproteobacteria bacterium]|nr:thiolase [Deltaproteobacteria bacterium]MBW2382246.1 thiolase [Deltaproteobacteria bacterium]MBW2698307.1 thiolase [Deltaproteobacteria bacterium]
MTLSGQIAIAGAYEHPTRFAPDKSESLIMAESARGALEEAGLRLADVDGLFAAGISMGPMGVVNLAEYLNIKPRYLDGTNIGGSSFVAHVSHAAAAIHAGLCEVALILYGSTAASSAMAIGTGLGGGGRDPEAAFVAPYGMTTVGSYALVARRHMHLYGTTPEQLAEIAVTMRQHASLNPEAKMQKRIDVADVLESRMISTPLHLLDCCIISDGGGAVIVTSLERARDLKQPPIVLRGCGEAVCHQEIGSPDLLTIAAKQSSEEAFAMSGLSHDDVDLCTIYDSFTITLLVTLENLGFCKPGEGGAFVEAGRIGLSGALPVNPDGGGLSSNHPGMRGIFLVIEAARQLRGGMGERQVDGAEVALVHGTGGTLGAIHSGATLLLSRD